MNIEIDKNRSGTLLVSDSNTVSLPISYVNLAGDDARAVIGRADKPFSTINGALTALSGLIAVPWELRIGPGDYPLHSTPGQLSLMNLPPHCRVIGYGIGLTTILPKFTALPGTIHYVIVGVNGHNFVSDLRVDIRESHADWGDGAGVHGVSLNGWQSRIERVEVRGIKAVGAVESWGMGAQWVDGCRVTGAPGTGGYSAFMVRRDGCLTRSIADFSGAKGAAYLNGFTADGNRAQISHCTAIGMTSGVYIDTVIEKDNLLEGVLVHDCIFGPFSGIGSDIAIRLRPVNRPDNKIRGLGFYNNLVLGLREKDRLAEIVSRHSATQNVGEVSHIWIDNNRVTGESPLSPIFLDRVSDVEISRNSFLGNFPAPTVQAVDSERVTQLLDVR